MSYECEQLLTRSDAAGTKAVIINNIMQGECRRLIALSRLLADAFGLSVLEVPANRAWTCAAVTASLRRTSDQLCFGRNLPERHLLLIRSCQPSRCCPVCHSPSQLPAQP